jgi:hypothetical protein
MLIITMIVIAPVFSTLTMCRHSSKHLNTSEIDTKDILVSQMKQLREVKLLAEACGGKLLNATVEI